MFTDKELKMTRDYADRKVKEVLKRKDGSDADYIRDLQTLIKLKNAAGEELGDVPSFSHRLKVQTANEIKHKGGN